MRELDCLIMPYRESIERATSIAALVGQRYREMMFRVHVSCNLVKGCPGDA